MHAIKNTLSNYQRTARSAKAVDIRQALLDVCATDALFRMSYPFGDLHGPDAFYSQCLEPLLVAMPDLERRDMIVLSGVTPEGLEWIGTMGNYMGTFSDAFLNIPATGHLAHMRYHEFFQIDNGKVVQVQAIWDIPELMMQSNAWPMAPQLGAFLCTPGPMSCDGLQVSGDGQATQEHVICAGIRQILILL